MRRLHWISLAGMMLLAMQGPVLSASVCPGTSCDGPAELPRAYIDTSYATNFPTNYAGYISKTVCASGCDYTSLQTALNNVVQVGGNVNGEFILLAPGQTFSGSFSLPAYTMSPGKWIIIKTDTPDFNLPGEGVRITPSYSPILAKIFTPGSNLPAIQALSQSNHYWFKGVEIGVSPTVTAIDTMVMIGQAEASASLVPHDIVFDRCYIHGNPTGGFKRGLNPAGINIALVNSYLEDFHVIGQEAQAVGTWNAPGPLKIVNNYLEGAGENILFGGAQARIPNVIASDIEIRFNHIDKPVSWYQPFSPNRWTVKNLIEFKNAQRVLVEGNVVEHAWADAQVGRAIILTPRGQAGGMPWATAGDITLRFNLIRHATHGLGIAGQDDTGPSQPSQRVAVHDNIWDDINGVTWRGQYAASPGHLFLVGNGGNGSNLLPPHDITIDHNTGFQDGQSLGFGDNAKSHFIAGVSFANNITAENTYGVFGSGSGAGNQAFTDYAAPPWIFTNNLLMGAGLNWKSYPTATYFPHTWAAVQFVDFANQDYHLASGSPYKNQASDAGARQLVGLSADLGADIDAVIRYTCYAVTGDPSASCSSLPPSAPPPSLGKPGQPGQPGQPPATGVTPLPTPVVRPNPWRADRHASGGISFDSLPGNVTLKIFTSSGHLVREFGSVSNSLTWDLTTTDGHRVASGVYIYLVTDGGGQKVRGKLAIIK